MHGHTNVEWYMHVPLSVTWRICAFCPDIVFVRSYVSHGVEIIAELGCGPVRKTLTYFDYYVWRKSTHNTPNLYMRARTHTHTHTHTHTYIYIYIYIYIFTYSIVQSPSWEANWFAASQEIPRILWNPKVHYRINKLPPPVPILG